MIFSPGSLWSKAVVPDLFGTRHWFSGRQFFHGRGAGGGELKGDNVRGRERWGVADEDEAVLAHLLTSYYAAWFLTGRRPVPGHGPGVGEPCSKEHKLGVHEISCMISFP